MIISNYYRIAVALVLLLTMNLASKAEVKLPPIISNGMILQRDAELKIWGWAVKDEKVTVEFNGLVKETLTGLDKKWFIIFPAMPAGGPHQMKIKGENEIEINNILIGDVWLCGGQSNMAMTMLECMPNYKTEIDFSKKISEIRLIKIKNTATSKPFDEFLATEWMLPNSDNLSDFSAVAYFFAKDLYQKYKIPIGLVSSNWGGSPAEVWCSSEALKEFPEIIEEYKRIEISMEENLRKQKLRERDLDKWVAEARDADEGFQENKPKWYEWHQSEKDWKSIPVPGDWNQYGLGNLDGIVWFRKEVVLPESAISKDLELDLGYIDDMDVAWFNGSVVGNHDKYDERRIYKIPAGLAKAGKNVIAVRVIDYGGGGGITGNIKIKGKDFDLAIDGEWRYKIGYDFKKMAKFIPPDYSYNSNWKPSHLFNGMIYPILNYKIKGAIWYQGEANVDKALQYRRLFPTMINDWRKNWGIGDFPFLYVQLANFVGAPSNSPQTYQSAWAELREAQEKTLALPNTGMATAIDIGEANDIHPKNKQDVGKRLALLAMKIANNDKYVAPYSPQFESMKIEGLKIRISLKNIGSGMTIRGGQYMKNIIVAGVDKKFYPAKAYLDGNEIIVEFPKEVHTISAIRYGWANSPEGMNLYNKEGLPLLPFRTDDWPGITK